MTVRMKVSRRSGTKLIPISRPMRGAKIIEVESQLMRSKKGSSLSSLSVMYLELFVFSKKVPFFASYSTSVDESGVESAFLHMM